MSIFWFSLKHSLNWLIMPKGHHPLTLAELRGVRPVGRAIADWLHEVGATDVSWYKNKHGHLNFTLDGKIYESTFATTPRCGDEISKRVVIQLKKLVGVW